MKPLISSLLFLLWCGTAAADGNIDPNLLYQRFETQKFEFPQEKIHVHTDRDFYLGGDTIWLRAHVVDAASHLPVKASKYVYVELKSPADSLAIRIKIKEENGVYAGYIPLPNEVIEADYTLSAYTFFMQNLGEPYFFKKTLRIGSPFATKFDINTSYNFDEENGDLRLRFSFLDKQTGEPAALKEMVYVKPDGKRGKAANPRGIAVNLSRNEQSAPYMYVAFDHYRKFIPLPDFSGEFEVSFHPEGGYIVPGRACKVAFKALNKNGAGVDVEGRILDSRGKEVAKFHSLHAGMGFFTMLPLAGERYTAVCSGKDGLEKSFPLPPVNNEATVLIMAENGQKVDFSTTGSCRDGILVVHERGNFLFAGQFSDRDSVLSVKTDGIRPGVVNAVLFDKLWNPLSERVFFVRGNAKAEVRTAAGKPRYNSREKVNVDLALKGFVAKKGNFSVAVTDDNSVPQDSATSILASLLLCSEIKGFVEDPAFYFNPGNPNAKDALDALMLTQGWRRYDVPDVVAGKFSQPSAEMEIGQEIQGRIRSKWRNKPESGASVCVLVPKYGYAGVFPADSEGKFLCNGFDFPENTTLLLMALDKNGKRLFPNFSIEPTEFPSTIPAISRGLDGLTDICRSKAWDGFIAAEKTRFQYNGMAVSLDEIIVQGFKIKQSEDFFEAVAFQSFDYKEMEKAGATSVEEMLRKIAGLRISSDGYFSFRSQPTALVIDGVLQRDDMVSQGDFYSVNSPNSEPVDGFASGKLNSFGGSPAVRTPKLSSYGHTKPELGFNSGQSSQLSVIERIPFDMIRRVDFLQPAQALTFGQNASGGAIVITTKRGNEIDSKEFHDHIAVTPLGYQKKATFYSPKYDTPETLNSSIPDLRPTLYWNPCVQIGNNGKASFSFFSSDAPSSTYSVRIEGVSDDGEIIQSNFKIKKD